MTTQIFSNNQKLSVKYTDIGELNILTSDVKSFYNNVFGDPDEKHKQTRAMLREQLRGFLGNRFFYLYKDIDFDPSTGRMTLSVNAYA